MCMYMTGAGVHPQSEGSSSNNQQMALFWNKLTLQLETAQLPD